MAAGRRGWKWDIANTRLSVYVDGTELGYFNDSTRDLTLLTNGLTVVAGGLTVTAGNLATTAGDLRVTAGNYRLGAVETFVTTEPTSAMVFKQGTAPVGAIATSGALYTDGTDVMKIIADGTASNVLT